MRQLPRKRNEKQNLIIKAVNDYFGRVDSEEKKSAKKIALWLMNRRSGLVLTGEEIEIKEMIKGNLARGNPPSKIDCSEFSPQFCEGVRR